MATHRPSSVSVRARGRRSQWDSAVAPSPIPRPSSAGCRHAPAVQGSYFPFAEHPRELQHRDPILEPALVPLSACSAIPSSSSAQARASRAVRRLRPNPRAPSMDSKSTARAAHPPSYLPPQPLQSRPRTLSRWESEIPRASDVSTSEAPPPRRQPTLCNTPVLILMLISCLTTN